MARKTLSSSDDLKMLPRRHASYEGRVARAAPYGSRTFCGRIRRIKLRIAFNPKFNWVEFKMHEGDTIGFLISSDVTSVHDDGKEIVISSPYVGTLTIVMAP